MLLGSATSLGILVVVLTSSGTEAPAWAMLTSTESAVWLLMAGHTASGHLLARLYATVLAATNVLFTIGLFSGQEDSLGTVPTISGLFLFNAVIAATVVGLLWTPTAEPFFDVD